MKHAYTDLVAKLRYQAKRHGLDTADPSEASTLFDLAADIIDRHGQLLVRLKSAIGPALVRAAEIEATA